MASLLQTHRVKYLIDGDRDEYECLARLYFCVYCLELRSADSLQHEVESHFCSQTLEGWTSNDANTKKHKSGNSWLCPSCCHPLSIRASNTVVVVPGSSSPSKTASRKSYYQVCNFCRWQSRDVGIADKDVANGAWKEKENPNQARVNELKDYYAYVVQKEKAERNRPTKSSYLSVTMQLQQRYMKKTPGLSSLPLHLKDGLPLKEVKLEPSATVGLDEVERLPDHIRDTPVDFSQATSIKQRHNSPAHQPLLVSEFWPRQSMMLPKKSLRCKKCDHNIIKPEYNPSSIKFKIHLVAVNYIPEIRIHRSARLTAGKRTRVVLSLVNPTEHLIHVTFSPCPDDDKPSGDVNAQIEMPAGELVVARLDEAAEFTQLHEVDPEIGRDNPDVIESRRQNRVAFYCHVTPSPSPDLARPRAVAAFRFRHEHFDNSHAIVTRLGGGGGPGNPPAEPLVPDWITHTVRVDFGPLAVDE